MCPNIRCDGTRSFWMGTKHSLILRQTKYHVSNSSLQQYSAQGIFIFIFNQLKEKGHMRSLSNKI